MVIGNIVSKCQIEFVLGRQILDGVVVVNEIIDLGKRQKNECLMLKVEFEKAYDNVNWNFLRYMLSITIFENKW